MNANAPARTDIDFEPDRLERYLSSVLPQAGGPLVIERIGGGQSNPTYFVDAPRRRMVLRKRPPGEHARGAHDVGREFCIISALHTTPAPTPAPILYCETPDVVGTPFYLMERLEGRVFHDASLPEVARDERRACYAELARVLAALHAVDVDAVGLGGLRRPGRFLARQVELWTRQWGALAESDPEVSFVINWLRANIPLEEDSAIVHGDYKLTNVIYAPEGTSIVGVLDWELCTVGDPLCDLAHIWSFVWHTTLEEYGGVRGLDLEALGLPTAEAFFDDYYAHAKRQRRPGLFHFVLAHFRNAGIFHGIGGRAAAGVANAGNAAEKGRLDRVYLARAAELIEASRRPARSLPEGVKAAARLPTEQP